MITGLPIYIKFLLLLALLSAVMHIYLRLAQRMGMVAIPVERSSHDTDTLKSAGIIIPISVLIYWVFDREVSGVLLIGILICAAIGFYDDLRGLGVGLRLLAQILASGLLVYYELPDLPIYIVCMLVVIAVGSINIYNFMDGINGMLAGYSLVTIVSLLWIDYHEGLQMSVWLYPALAAIGVFGYFNFRSNARCFAGDVGSLSMGFLVTAVLMIAIYRTSSYSYAMLLSVYYIDGGITIIQRLLRGENILKAHRFHLYEILVNERKYSHLSVAICYLSIQGIVNGYTLFMHPIVRLPGYIDLTGIIVLLVLIYLLIKGKVTGN